jgi:hypothetical protein
MFLHGPICQTLSQLKEEAPVKFLQTSWQNSVAMLGHMSQDFKAKASLPTSSCAADDVQHVVFDCRLKAGLLRIMLLIG